jgi:Cu/Ag efflux pump CusA
VHGLELRFAFDAAGVAVKFSGTVRGGEITGVLSTRTAVRTAKGRLHAVVEAGRLRLRPILMTTATTVLGLAPLALGIGVGAESGNCGRSLNLPELRPHRDRTRV